MFFIENIKITLIKLNYKISKFIKNKIQCFGLNINNFWNQLNIKTIENKLKFGIENQFISKMTSNNFIIENNSLKKLLKNNSEFISNTFNLNKNGKFIIKTNLFTNNYFSNSDLNNLLNEIKLKLYIKNIKSMNCNEIIEYKINNKLNLITNSIKLSNINIISYKSFLKCNLDTNYHKLISQIFKLFNYFLLNYNLEMKFNIQIQSLMDQFILRQIYVKTKFEIKKNRWLKLFKNEIQQITIETEFKNNFNELNSNGKWFGVENSKRDFKNFINEICYLDKDLHFESLFFRFVDLIITESQVELMDPSILFSGKVFHYLCQTKRDIIINDCRLLPESLMNRIRSRCGFLPQYMH